MSRPFILPISRADVLDPDLEAAVSTFLSRKPKTTSGAEIVALQWDYFLPNQETDTIIATKHVGMLTRREDGSLISDWRDQVCDADRPAFLEMLYALHTESTTQEGVGHYASEVWSASGIQRSVGKYLRMTLIPGALFLGAEYIPTFIDPGEWDPTLEDATRGDRAAVFGLVFSPAETAHAQLKQLANRENISIFADELWRYSTEDDEMELAALDFSEVLNVS